MSGSKYLDVHTISNAVTRLHGFILFFQNSLFLRIMGQGQRDRKLFGFDSKKDENTFIYYNTYNI